MGEGHVHDPENALKKTYPDYSDINSVSRATALGAPTNISDTLAYWDFTTAFAMQNPQRLDVYGIEIRWQYYTQQYLDPDLNGSGRRPCVNLRWMLSAADRRQGTQEQIQ